MQGAHGCCRLHSGAGAGLGEGGEGQPRLPALSRAPRDTAHRSWDSPAQGQPQWRDVLCHMPGCHPRPCPHPRWVSWPQDGQHLQLCAVVPKPEPAQHQGSGLSSCWQNLGQHHVPWGGSSATSPHWGPSSCPVLGQGCSWGVPLSLQAPSSSWGARCFYPR
uniref:Uncharacterized protein n=1 Tax=Cyanistes caeruleus TaxID=156563 RepID=A0A8C0Z955_CYACU